MSAHPQRQLYEKVGPLRYGWWLFWLNVAGPLHRKGDPYKGRAVAFVSLPAGRGSDQYQIAA